MRISLNDIENFLRCPARASFSLQDQREPWLLRSYFAQPSPLFGLMQLAYTVRFRDGKDLSWQGARGFLCETIKEKHVLEGLLLRAALWHKWYLADERDGISDFTLNVQIDNCFLTEHIPLLLLPGLHAPASVVLLETKRSYFEDELFFIVLSWGLKNYLELTSVYRETYDFVSLPPKRSRDIMQSNHGKMSKLFSAISTIYNQDIAYPVRGAGCTECSFIQRCIDKWS